MLLREVSLQELWPCAVAAVGAAVTPTRKTRGVETLNEDTCESVMLSTISVSVCTFLKSKSSQTSYSSVWAHTCARAASAGQGTESYLVRGKGGGAGRGAGCARRLAELDLGPGLMQDLCPCRSWWMCPARQTGTLSWRRRTTSSTGDEPRSARCCPCCSCSC